MALKNGSIASAVAAGCIAMTGTSNAVTPAGALQGNWAGDQFQLVIDAQGGRLEGDCASGRFQGPVTTSDTGRFNVQGTFDARGGGPQRADVAPSASGATFSGEVHNATLKLTITPTTGGQPQVYTLQAGARIKLHRCL